MGVAWHGLVDADHSHPLIRGVTGQGLCAGCFLRENIHLVVLGVGRGMCHWMIDLIVR
jgi:hypothetical protein